MTDSQFEPYAVVHAEGRSPYVLVCDHASNFIPPAYGDLGLSRAERNMHIAWDPGALAVAMQMVRLLDAPLIYSNVSRLVIDCNRSLDAPDLIPTTSEWTAIAANRGLGAAEREARIAKYHAPFHRAIDRVLAARVAAGMETILVCVHSFTPIYKGVGRPWEVSVMHGPNAALTLALARALAADAPSLTIGINEPYSALTGTTYTLGHHSDAAGLHATMIEIRNDEITEPSGVTEWAARLARCLVSARGAQIPVPAMDEQLKVSEPGGTNG